MPDGMQVFQEMSQYSPFAVEACDEVVFTLQVVDIFPAAGDVTVELNQDDDGSQIVAA